MTTQAPKMDLSTFTSLSFSAQVSHLKDLNTATAPMWLVSFHEGYFQYNVLGMGLFPQSYKDAYLRLAEYRRKQMTLTPDELEAQFSGGCANQYHPKPYSASSYTHS
jgi:hypothetical protein